MFTGIVEELGVVKAITTNNCSARLTISADLVLQDAKVGDSIAVNGVCLTITDYQPKWFAADVMPETMKRSSLGELRNGSNVNLERALRLADRLGGHLVSGHVDDVGVIKSKQKVDNAIIVTISTEPTLLRYVVKKGSIAIDGISLTVVECGADWFSVSVIPHTMTVTTLGGKTIGSFVNIETDVLAKYTEKLLSKDSSKINKLDQTFLAVHGFLD